MKQLIIGLVRLYQKYISPLTPPTCRYQPTCSSYMIEAVERFGVVRGTLIGLARILRCHPWAPGGIDNVPDHFSLKRQPPPPRQIDKENGSEE